MRGLERESKQICVVMLASSSQGYIIPGLGDAGDRTFGTL